MHAHKCPSHIASDCLSTSKKMFFLRGCRKNFHNIDSVDFRHEAKTKKNGCVALPGQKNQSVGQIFFIHCNVLTNDH